jgi:hypothetical protein
MFSSKFFKTGIIVWLLPYASTLGQFNPLHQVEKKMEQGKWENAHEILNKALGKDSLNVQAELMLSVWFLNQNNPAKQIDSAYHHNLKALHAFQKSPLKQKEKLKHDQTDSASIVRLREKIDSLAFENAKQINTEQSYKSFIQKFLYAKERIKAIELRDEIAFVNVLRENSYKAFDDYLKLYPKSHRAVEAKERYEKLLFDSKTKDKKIKSYLSFVKEYPSSPYRLIADKNIFEVSTSGGSPEDFIKFIIDYPQNSFVNRACDILFYVSRESIDGNKPRWMTDSLRKVIEINKLNWVPVYKNGKYGFMDSHGTETFPPQFDEIKEDYKCGSVIDDILVTSDGLFSRNGKHLNDKTWFSKDLGFGFLKVGDTSCVKVLHKSGVWVIKNCVQDAVVLNGRFLVIKTNGLLGLYTLSGRMIWPAQWSSIEMIEGVVVLDRAGKKTLCLPSQLAMAVDGNPLPENFVFDNVKSLGDHRLLVSNGTLEGIINSNLEFVVPLARQSLFLMPFGLVRKINDQFIFTDMAPELENTTWERYQFYRQWLLLRNQNEEKLVDTHSKKIIESNPDSLWVANGLVFASERDSVHVHINSSTRITLAKNAKLTFVKSADSIQFFFTELKNKKTIFSIESGKKLFTSDYDQIESLTSEIFIATKKNKKGLLDKKGKLILPIEYDALVLHSKNLLSLLMEKKFGLYDLVSAKLIKPIYERNISLLDSTTLIAFKDGNYGLINWEAKPLTAFEFSEIQPWNKNVVWVKKDTEWSLFDFTKSNYLLRHVKTFHLISDKPTEKLAMVQQENYFGILSNSRGMIIPVSFSSITNLGSEDDPLYFTAKEVEEAGIVVVIYYNKEGKLLRKQVYEDEEYAHVICPED